MRFSKALIAVAAGCQFAAAVPMPQDDGNVGTSDTDVCSLSSRDPASWAASGGEDQVNSFIADKGEGRWLLELDKTQEGKGGSAAISCGSIGATGCATPQAACSTYNTKSYFFVMTMVARVNEVFSVAHRKLTSATITDILAIGKIIDDFKIPGDPATGDPEAFRTTAAALTMADKVLKQFKPLGPLADVLGFIGGAFGIAAAQNQVKVTDYAALQRDMEDWLSKLFSNSEDIMERALASLMGEGEEGDKILDDLLEQMNNMGLTNFGSDYNSPVSKVLAGGKFMPPATDSDINSAFDEGFKSMRHGMIGNYLSGLRGFVQKDDTTKQGDCKAEQGKYWDGSACHSLLVKNVLDKIEPFSEGTIKKFKDYDLNFETFMKNVIDCNNGKVDPNNFNIEGDYPKCYFGLVWADRVEGTAQKCQTNYKNWKDMPKWLFDRGDGNHKDCKDSDIKVPFSGNCLVNSGTVDNWIESALARYRYEITGNGVDLGGICSYINTGRCTGASNIQCWKDGDKILADASYVQGPLGVTQSGDCIQKSREEFQRDNDCRTG